MSIDDWRNVIGPDDWPDFYDKIIFGPTFGSTCYIQRSTEIIQLDPPPGTEPRHAHSPRLDIPEPSDPRRPGR